MSKINIEIHDNFAILNLDGVIRTIKLESLIKGFSSVTTSIESPILPTNCVKYKEKGTSIDVILYHEPTTFNASVGYSYQNLVQYENCQRPGLIVKYNLSRQVNDTYVLNNSVCFGVKDPYIAINDKTRLWGLPFPNIASTGSICWGNNSSTGTFTSLVGLKSYIERIFNSPFTPHLFNLDLLRATSGINDIHDFFKAIQNIDNFPYELFEGIGESSTIGNM